MKRNFLFMLLAVMGVMLFFTGNAIAHTVTAYSGQETKVFEGTICYPSGSTPSASILNQPTDGSARLSQPVSLGQGSCGVDQVEWRLAAWYTSNSGYIGEDEFWLYWGVYIHIDVNVVAGQSAGENTSTQVLRAATTQVVSAISSRVSAVLAPRNPASPISVGPGQVSLHSDFGSASLSEGEFNIEGSYGLSSGDRLNGLGVWGSLSWTDMRNNFVATDYSGDLYVLSVGADYPLLDDRAVVGLALAYERLNLGTNFNNIKGDLKNNGWTIAPYGALKIADQTMIDLMVGYSRVKSDVDSRPGGVLSTGGYHSDRYMISGNLTHHIFVDRLTIAPQASLLYASEKAGSYIMTGGNNVQSLTTRLGQAGAGGTLSYSFAALTPYVTAKYLYDFEMTKTNIAGAANDRDELFAAAGFNFAPSDRLFATLEVSNSFARSQVRNTSIMGSLRYQF